MVDWDLIRFAWMVCTTIIAVAAAGGALYLRAEVKRQVGEASESSTRALYDHGQRLTAIETAILHAPKREDLTVIHNDIRGVSNQLAHLTGTYEANNTTMRLIHEYLLTGDKR